MTRFLIGVLAVATLASAQRLKDLQIPASVKPGDTIVIGFLGGFERWNDDSRRVRKLILKLRESPGVHAESFSNHNVLIAREFIERAARSHPRVIILGQSLGGAAAIELARAMRARHIPVALTAQIDSVGLRDGVIPDNVLAAVNYFQHTPLTIWGRAQITAADPGRTRILGNYERRYPMFDSSLMSPQSSWARKHLGGGHARMEDDAEMWNELETLIHREIVRN